MYSAKVSDIHAQFNSPSNDIRRYYLGSIAEVIGISLSGCNFVLWLDNKEKLTVPGYQELTVLSLGGNKTTRRQIERSTNNERTTTGSD